MKPNIYTSIRKPPPTFEIAERPCLDQLVDLYEGNFRLLRQLVPGLRGFTGSSVSLSADTPDLHLQIIEQSPYTSQFSLTWYFDWNNRRCPEPDFRLRASHDASLLEVISFQAGGGVVVQGNTHRPMACHVLSTLDWKWQVNIFLKKWLGYCLENGHRFPAEQPHSISADLITPGNS